ncbi:MAG: AMP-binding protein [Jatrophihabitantaceae bacterium]
MNTPVGPSDLVRQHAGSRPDALALVDTGVRLTWAELDSQSTRAALALLAAGAQPGDRVALSLRTGAQFAIAYLGALRAGLIAVPINPSSTEREVEHIVGDSGARLHLTADAVAQLAASAPAGEDPHADRTGEATAVLLYTGGTGGQARGAMLSARALMANLDQLAAIEPPLLVAGDVLFVPLPLSHVFGLNAGLGMALRVGATAVLADRFDPAATLATMAAEHVTAVVGVPGQYAAWLSRPDVAESFASVRFAMSGSATLTRATVDGFRALGVVLHDGYGLTEAAPVVAVNAIGAARERPRPGSVGCPIPGVEVQLRDGDGAVDEAGDPGRVFVRGANLFSGYWPLGDDGPVADGWFGTGDLAVQDADGALHLVGRSAELVVVNGFNVYPAEVEAVLAAEPGVAEVAVVGVPDERAGEAVRAYVVPTAGTVLDPDELLAAATRSLARFKLPGTIELVSSLPHTVTGRVMKWALGSEEGERGRD